MNFKINKDTQEVWQGDKKIADSYPYQFYILREDGGWEPFPSKQDSLPDCINYLRETNLEFFIWHSLLTI